MVIQLFVFHRILNQLLEYHWQGIVLKDGQEMELISFNLKLCVCSFLSPQFLVFFLICSSFIDSYQFQGSKTSRELQKPNF